MDESYGWSIPYEEVPKDEDSLTKKFMTSKEGALQTNSCIFGIHLKSYCRSLIKRETKNKFVTWKKLGNS